MSDDYDYDDCSCDAYDDDDSCDWGDEPDYYFDGDVVDSDY